MNNKIGIVLPFQNGDLITATSCLHYRKELWGDADIVWFCNEPHSDALKFQDIEIRYFPHGWDILENDITNQYAERVIQDKAAGRPEWEDWTTIKNSDNRLNQELKNKFNSFKDLDEAYFAAPWMLSPTQRHGLEYPQCSKKIFGINMDWEWHPVLMFSEEERLMVADFMLSLPNRKNFLIETFGGSGQTSLSEVMIRRTIEICREKYGKCNFIFASHKFLYEDEIFPEWLLNEDGFVSIKHLTIRQTALVIDFCDLMVCVSSGISVATSCWGAKPVTKLQYCGSSVCSTVALANGRIETVYCDDRNLNECEDEFYEKLNILLC